MMEEHAEPTGNDPLEYQGRKASRAKSEHRRLQILEASLRIVCKEGVRGIRHRAVAKEAGVPLAATTYYFRDIDELIIDTFTLYTEKAISVLNDFTAHFYQPLSGFLQQDVRSPAAKEKLIDFMTDQVTGYMQNQVQGQRNMLIIEQAFRYEALINSKVHDLAQLHRQALYGTAINFFADIARSPNPRADAEILVGLFHTIEYNSLLNSPEPVDIAQIRSIIKHYISLIVTVFFS